MRDHQPNAGETKKARESEHKRKDLTEFTVAPNPAVAPGTCTEGVCVRLSMRPEQPKWDGQKKEELVGNRKKHKSLIASRYKTGDFFS